MSRKINPNIRVKPIHGDLFLEVGLGLYRHADLVISGLDNLAARSKVGQCCYLTGIPFLDSGIWSMGGEVRLFLPNEGFCFDCTLEETDWSNAHQRKSCTGFKPDNGAANAPTPSNITTASIIGGIVTQEAVRYLCGGTGLKNGHAIVYNGLSIDMHISELPGETNCRCKLGSPFDEVLTTGFSVKDARPADLFKLFSSEIKGSLRIELGRNLLTGYDCSHCTKAECQGCSENGDKPKLVAQTPGF